MRGSAQLECKLKRINGYFFVFSAEYPEFPGYHYSLVRDCRGVSSGHTNQANYSHTSVSEGYNNIVANHYTSVSGENGTSVSTLYGWTVGPLHPP